jgi:hypothetical protein
MSRAIDMQMTRFMSNKKRRDESSFFSFYVLFINSLNVIFESSIEIFNYMHMKQNVELFRR